MNNKLDTYETLLLNEIAQLNAYCTSHPNDCDLETTWMREKCVFLREWRKINAFEEQRKFATSVKITVIAFASVTLAILATTQF